MYENLYSENRGLLIWAARRYSRAGEIDPAISPEDIMQTGFIGLCRASQTFDPSKGTWMRWAMLCIVWEIDAMLGLGRRSGEWKVRSGALSLDAPLEADADETLLDTLPDEALPETDAALILDDTCRTVRACVASLRDDRQREVVQRWQLGGETQAAVAHDMGVTPQAIGAVWSRARRKLKSDPRMRALIDVPSFNTGYRRFRETGVSAVEHMILWRERQLERLAGVPGGPCVDPDSGTTEANFPENQR